MAKHHHRAPDASHGSRSIPPPVRLRLDAFVVPSVVSSATVVSTTSLQRSFGGVFGDGSMLTINVEEPDRHPSQIACDVNRSLR